MNLKNKPTNQYSLHPQKKAGATYLAPENISQSYGFIGADSQYIDQLECPVICIYAGVRSFLDDYHDVMANPEEILYLENALYGQFSFVYRRGDKALGFLVDSFTDAGQTLAWHWHISAHAMLALGYEQAHTEYVDYGISLHNALQPNFDLFWYCSIDDIPTISEIEEEKRLVKGLKEHRAGYDIPGLILTAIR